MTKKRSELPARFPCEPFVAYRGMGLVRRIYGVPAYRGREVVFTGLKHPVAGRIISCNGSHLWIRTNEGRRFGPLHPTWEIDYGE